MGEVKMVRRWEMRSAWVENEPEVKVGRKERRKRRCELARVIEERGRVGRGERETNDRNKSPQRRSFRR